MYRCSQQITRLCHDSFTVCRWRHRRFLPPARSSRFRATECTDISCYTSEGGFHHERRDRRIATRQHLCSAARSVYLKSLQNFFISVSPTALSEANFSCAIMLTWIESHSVYCPNWSMPRAWDATRSMCAPCSSWLWTKTCRAPGAARVVITRQTSGPVGSCHDCRGFGKRHYPIIALHPGAHGSQGDSQSGGGDIIQSYFKTRGEVPMGTL